MTREEAKDVLINLRKTLVDNVASELDINEIEALDMSIQALEQEPIIDKIRAEIEQDAFKDVSGSKYIFINRVNQIIDKYSGERKVRDKE